MNKQLIEIIEFNNNNNHKFLNKSKAENEINHENESKFEKLYLQYKETTNNLAEEVIILRNQLDKFLHYKKN